LLDSLLQESSHTRSGHHLDSPGNAGRWSKTEVKEDHGFVWTKYPGFPK